MRLEYIKLIGFKSFVDNTTLSFTSNLTAIVGPNGCGKSNLIDAIRWVMGESSAKQLRGQTLEDVVFNGCRTRKAAGQAAVELIFDNKQARLGGQYRQYTQLAIRREITREGQSVYYLNGTRCRRRDIRDIFLGTGLGPRSYAIIEQGMISRLVEAKPDELRTYVEEAAGISKYKERRRETEHSLQHTQENLNRLKDISNELNRQSKNLQRQANKAERYKSLKAEKRLLETQLHALRYQTVIQELRAESITLKKNEISIEKVYTQQQKLEKEIALLHKTNDIIRDKAQQIQASSYQAKNDIIRLQESLTHQKLQLEQQQKEKQQLNTKLASLVQQLQKTEQTKIQLTLTSQKITEAMSLCQTDLARQQSTLQQCQQATEKWQLAWDEFNRVFSQLNQKKQLTLTHSQIYQQRYDELIIYITQATQELDEQNQILLANNNLAQLKDLLANAHQQKQSLQAEQEKSIQQINQQRAKLQLLRNELDDYKDQLRTNQAKSTSLISLQEEILGQTEKSSIGWLTRHRLTNHARLAQTIEVEPGWEHAIESVLHPYLHAICLNEEDSLEYFLNQSLPNHPLAFFLKKTSAHDPSLALSIRTDLPLLSQKITCNWLIEELLLGVYAVDSPEEACQYLSTLNHYEKIVTREGIYFGKHWLTIPFTKSKSQGLLKRQREITNLRTEQSILQTKLVTSQTEYLRQQTSLHILEKEQVQKQTLLTASVARYADINAEYQLKTLRIEQAQQHIISIKNEIETNKKKMIELQTVLEQIQDDQQTIESQLQQTEMQHNALVDKKTLLQTEVHQATLQLKVYETKWHQLALQQQHSSYELTTTNERLSWIQQEQTKLQKYYLSLTDKLKQSQTPIVSTQAELETKQHLYNQLNDNLKQNQTELQNVLLQLKEKEQQAQALEKDLKLYRDQLEKKRLHYQALQIRANTLLEPLQTNNVNLEQLFETLPPNEQIATHESKLQTIANQLEQLGAVNLIALEEYQAVLKRSTYLEKQCQDLNEALATLELAIQKINRETRQRFQTTFDEINKQFTILFPRLFSGGSACLQLQNPDLPNSGICVMAQPSGKKNSSIQLLSGGEKALTAIALVFSFFQLNPAPFCILDEVDAPLDDTNVIRFCQLVKEMAQELQFIFISHNKIAIEMADCLAGVTMHEPGVSRLVTVDIEKALAISSTY